MKYLSTILDSVVPVVSPGLMILRLQQHLGNMIPSEVIYLRQDLGIGRSCRVTSLQWKMHNLEAHAALNIFLTPPNLMVSHPLCKSSVEMLLSIGASKLGIVRAPRFGLRSSAKAQGNYSVCPLDLTRTNLPRDESHGYKLQSSD